MSALVKLPFSTSLKLNDIRGERPFLPLTNGTDNRSASAYLQVVATFAAAIVTEFYAPGGGFTWCNLFAWHLSIAMGCEIPHWIRGYETRANDLCDWLEHRLHNGGPMQGPELGWSEVSELDARARANAGHPTFATWKNPVPQKSGHIAAVLPSATASTIVAQAGRVCSLSVELSIAFGGAKPVRFWTHD